MNEILPIAPLYGMSPVLYLVLSVALGIAFGFFLERAGFGSAKNLTSIFILRDFRVFRVMFSAVITAMLGSQILGAAGLLDLSLIGFDPTFFWAMLTGGLLFGVGFYVGGYCPGTAAVALARGRWDGAAFLFGIVLGIYGFALLYDAVGGAAWFSNFYAPAGAARQTLYGSGPAWPWVLGLTAVALAAFKVVPYVEKRFALRTVEQLEAVKAGEPEPPAEPPRIRGVLLRVGPALAGAAALVVAVLEIGLPQPISRVEAASRPPAAVEADESPAPAVEPLTLATWVISEAHRRAEEDPPNAYFVDLRPGAERGRAPVPGAIALDVSEGDDRSRLVEALTELRDILTPSNRIKPVVLIDGAGDERTATLVADLRRRGVNAMMLEGGFAAWQRQVLDPEARWPTWEIAAAPPGEAPEVDLAAVQIQARRWLAGEAEELPPRFAIPGTVLLPAKAATVRARGGPGGGCG